MPASLWLQQIHIQVVSVRAIVFKLIAMIFRYCNFIILILLCFGLFQACNKENADDGDHITERDPPVLLRVTMNVHEKIGGFYLAHPARYNESSKKYPMILFIHGGGQFGSGAGDLPRLLTEGIPKLLKEKKFPSSFQSNGQEYSFIIAIPQFRSFPDNDALAAMLSYVQSAYRIDASRIYLAGFSIGGRVVCDFSAANPNSIAAFVAMSGVSSYDIEGKSKIIGQAALPSWGFHNRADQVFPWEDTKNFIAGINLFDPSKRSRLTVFEDSTGIQQHDSWTRATDASYKENGKNIYEWLLQFRR